MKIKGVEIKILKGKKLSAGGVLDQAVLPEADLYANEKRLRLACAQALKQCGRAQTKALRLSVSKAPDIFPPVAIAKIIAQEIYRFITEEKNGLKEVEICLSDQKIFRIFHKTIYGYLGHLLGVLAHGPFVTVDTIIEVAGGIVLIKRSNPPFGWAIPGGFVDYGETLEEAALREAREETGLHISSLRQMHTYSDPSRDPRFHTITTVFVGRAKGKPKAASDAADAKIAQPKDWKKLELAFDHKKVLSDYRKWKNSGT